MSYACPVKYLPNEMRSLFHRGLVRDQRSEFNRGAISFELKYLRNLRNLWITLSYACPVKYLVRDQRSEFNRGALVCSLFP
jgi:hypothetical protein